MHLLVRETRTLDDDAAADDLGHAPADLVLLSFSDSDLGAASAAWRAGDPSLRLAPLARLRHPMSVDLYAGRVVAHARCVVARILGGLDYWRYGAEEFSAVCRESGVALALLPGDDRDDCRLAALSTVPPDALALLDACFRAGGPDNVRAALAFAARLGGLDVPAPTPPAPVARAGEHALDVAPDGPAGVAAIVFYRSHLMAGDVAPVAAMARALAARGLGVRALHVASLKEPDCAALVADRLRAWRPRVVLNATAFAAGTWPLDVADAPVLQLALAGTTRAAWEESSRGLSQTDLAMQVVLPELDGRLLTTAISFKAEAACAPELSFARAVNAPYAPGVALAASRAAGWARLAATPRARRRVAIVLSDYPGAGGGQRGHAVGLDSFASLDAIATLLAGAGYDAAPLPGLHDAPPTPILSAAGYRALFAEKLPDAARARVVAAWGEPSDAIMLAHLRGGRLIAAIQPGRGDVRDRKSGYHDPDLPPCHAYIGFYLWLRYVADVDAVVQLGAHGTLEWLPGKAAAVSHECFPAALAGGVPAIYPFIVNNPGEAAAAKRRLGAVVLGHLTPPIRAAGAHGEAAALERLVDEYAAADGLDRRRVALLRSDILASAEASGLLAESGVAAGDGDDAALARLDAYLCDLKDFSLRDGLHVFGRAPASAWDDPAITARGEDCAAAERAGLLAALDGRFVAPGPAGAPTRARADVLPTGRNLFGVDPRAVPTRSAVALAERAAEEVLRRHAQDHGDWPRALLLDLWGSTTMRTGGEDAALALLLMGVCPLWDSSTARVSGIEVVPLALLDRPRVDVTVRISGLFRDAFPQLVALLDQAARAVAARDEDGAFNPLAAAARGLSGAALRRATARVFGAAPGAYGAGDADATGAGYLAASGHAYGRDLDGASASAEFAARVAAADALVHVQDHAETDLLDGTEVARHIGGFAAAARSLGAAPALHYLDTSRADAPRARPAAEEIARVVRARATNPNWIAGMRRHGYRGAAEIARTLDALHEFSAALPDRFDALFDRLFDATLGDADTDAFLRRENPAARAAMAARFADARARGLWRPRRNDVAALTEGA